MPDDKVTDITTRRNAPDPEVVRRLEMLLEQAKEGEISGIAYGIVFNGGACSHGFTCPTHGHALQLIAAISVLNVRMSGVVLDR